MCLLIPLVNLVLNREGWQDLSIGTGLFLGSGFAISLAGPSVLLSYAVGAILALLLMGCLAEMTIAHPSSGSFGFAIVSPA